MNDKYEYCYPITIVCYGILDETKVIRRTCKDKKTAEQMKELLENDWKSLLKAGYFDNYLEGNLKHTLKRVECILIPETGEPLINDRYISIVKNMID